MARHASATIIGRIGRTPELSRTKAGAVLNLSVAVDRGRDQEPDWYRVTIWREGAEQVDALGLGPGDLVFASGRLAMSHWSDKNGTQRVRPEITAGASSVQLLTRPRDRTDDRTENHATRRTRTDPRRQYQYDPAPPPPEYDDSTPDNAAPDGEPPF